MAILIYRRTISTNKKFAKATYLESAKKATYVYSFTKIQMLGKQTIKWSIHLETKKCRNKQKNKIMEKRAKMRMIMKNVSRKLNNRQRMRTQTKKKNNRMKKRSLRGKQCFHLFDQVSLEIKLIQLIKIFQIYNQTSSTLRLSMSDIESIRFQNDEFKALQYIYLQQFHTVKESNPQKFNIECQPYTGKVGEYKIKIMFEFTPNYPHTPLKYQIQPITGITRDNMNAIITTIQEILHTNKDRPIVYDIVEETRIWIQEYLVEGKAYLKDEESYMKKKQQVFEKPKFATFTPVTIDSFTAWKKEFDAKNKLKKVEKKQTEIKITGKQWFLGKKEDQIDEQDDEEDDEQYDDEQQEEAEEKIQIPRDDVQNNDLF